MPTHTLTITKNPDSEMYKLATQAVKDNDGYCPCNLQHSAETRCPCRSFREQEVVGLCHCGRYLKTN